jgi:hypothetical protein
MSNGSLYGDEQLPGYYGQEQFHFDFDPTWDPYEFHSYLLSFNKDGGQMLYADNYYDVEFGDKSGTEQINMTQDFFDMDNAPGSYLLTYTNMVAQVHDGFVDAGTSDVPFPTVFEDGRHCFIPLASALDLIVDIKTRAGVFAVATASTPSSFDATYASVNNSKHVDVSAYWGPLLYEIGLDYPWTIYVDKNFPGVELGTQSQPFRTFRRAYDFAWNGVIINVKSGNYPETGTFSKRVTIVANGGTAALGSP